MEVVLDGDQLLWKLYTFLVSLPPLQFLIFANLSDAFIEVSVDGLADFVVGEWGTVDL